MIRTYADADGESHFEEADLPFSPANFAPPAPPIDVSDSHVATRFLIARVPAGWAGSWHPPPARQFWVGISGTLQVTTSDGEKRDIEPGTPWLMEDVTGKGHATTAVGNLPAIGAITQLQP
jgi:hypothetical protein